MSHAIVRVGSQTRVGCDISECGLAVHVADPIELREVIWVTLSREWVEASLSEIKGRARVVGVDRGGTHFRVGLQFLDAESH